MLSEPTTLGLQKILEEEFSYDCSKAEADEIGTALVHLVEVLKELESEPYAKSNQ